MHFRGEGQQPIHFMFREIMFINPATVLPNIEYTSLEWIRDRCDWVITK